MNELGHDKQPEAGDVLSNLPFGFTYAVRREAVKAVGGVMDILRGEDRSVYIPLLNEFGENAINLRTKAPGNLVRLLGDNNSANAVHSLKTVWGSLKSEIDGIFEIWKPMLSQKYQGKLSPDVPTQTKDKVVTLTPSAQKVQ